MTPLRWIGRQRTRAIAAVVVLAILTPPLGALLRPFVTHAVIGLLILSFLRMDITACRAHLRRPHLVIATTLWTTLAVPVLVILTTKALGLDAALPGLFTGLILQAVASPMMAAPAIAALLGLDATLILVTLICSTILVPLSAPLFVAALALDLPLTPASLGVKLLLILAGSALVGLTLRRIIGPPRIAANRDEIDGLNIITLFVFASAIMADSGIEFFRHPLFMLALVALSILVTLLMLALTYAAFRTAGHHTALAVGVMASQRNMGLMLAGAGGAVPELTWLYFAAAQIPIHFTPFILHPLAKREPEPDT